MYRNTRYFANRWQNYYKNFIYANFREIFSPNSIKFYVYRANMGRLCLHKTTDRRTINKAQSAGEKISRKLAYVRQDANVNSEGTHPLNILYSNGKGRAEVTTIF